MNIDNTAIANQLVQYIRDFPFPFMDILNEQIDNSKYWGESYPYAFNVFFTVKPDVRRLPQYLPTVIQGCQVVKQDGPITCCVFIENGFIYTIEVVAMGLDPINWNWFFSHDPLFDYTYDLQAIYDAFTTHAVKITELEIYGNMIWISSGNSVRKTRLTLLGCKIKRILLPSEKEYTLIIERLEGESSKYEVRTEDYNIFVECELMYMSVG